MKIKASWAVFIPAFLSVMGVQLFQSISGTFSFGASLTAVIITAVMVVINTIIACADQYTVREYPPKRNVFSGIMLMISGVLIAISGISGLSSIFETEIEILQIVSIASALISSIVFILLGINTITGNFTITAAPIITLAPVIYFAVELIKQFIAYTTEAVAGAKMYDILYVIFLLIFFYYSASIYAGIPTKFAVKSCFIFGFPGVILTFAWCIKEFFPILNGEASFDFLVYLPQLIALAVSLFIVSFLLEVSLKANVTDYFSTDDEDFSEEEELFGLSAVKASNNRTLSRTPYEDMTRYGKNIEAQAEKIDTEDIKIAGETDTFENKEDKNTENIEQQDISEIVSDFEKPYVNTSVQLPEQEVVDEDLSWIDKLIQDIENEQQ